MILATIVPRDMEMRMESAATIVPRDTETEMEMESVGVGDTAGIGVLLLLRLGGSWVLRVRGLGLGLCVRLRRGGVVGIELYWLLGGATLK